MRRPLNLDVQEGKDVRAFLYVDSPLTPASPHQLPAK